jgi:hypothetical protein
MMTFDAIEQSRGSGSEQGARDGMPTKLFASASVDLVRCTIKDKTRKYNNNRKRPVSSNKNNKIPPLPPPFLHGASPNTCA